MRQRLPTEQRRADILTKAEALFIERGYAQTGMADIRAACGISRGGLYHHFDDKNAILVALVMEEIKALSRELSAATGAPVETLLTLGSQYLGNGAGLGAALTSPEEKRLYLSALDQAFLAHVRPALEQKLRGHLRDGANPSHIAELFLAVNRHINQRIFLGEWTSAQGAGFSATALKALQPFLHPSAELAQIIKTLEKEARQS